MPPTHTNIPLYALVSLAAIGLSACSKKDSAPPTSPTPPPLVSSRALPPRVPPPSGSSATLFEALPPSQIPFTSSSPSAGIAIGDLNGDDRPDILFSGGTSQNALFLQSDPTSLRYFDATSTSNLGSGSETAPASGVAMADIDNDSDNDLFICYEGAPDALFINDGNSPPGFVNQAAVFGFVHVDQSLLPAFADYDLDGDLDLFLLTSDGNHRLYRNEHLSPDKTPETPKFTDVSASAFIAPNGPANTALWFDYNLDGYPDLFVGGAPASGHQLYMNNGNGTFIDVAPASLPGSHEQVLAAAASDLDGDTWPDLLAVGTSASPSRPSNRLYLNSGTHRFLEAAQLGGIPGTGDSFALKIHDFDCDGRSDLLFANATPPEPFQPLPNNAYKNLGQLRFALASSNWLPGNSTSSSAVASADLDRDGDLDLVIANLDSPASILRNTSTANHSLVVRLVGRASHPAGIGARLSLLAEDETTQTRQLNLGSGGPSGDEPLVHFGLGLYSSAQSLTIHWPSGLTSTIKDPRAERIYTITEPSTTEPAEPPAPPARSKPLFAESSALIDIVHNENDFDDFALQPLVPKRLSRLGPTVAVADIDRDGDDDFFLGGSVGQPGRTFINDGTGSFTEKPQPGLEPHIPCEDASAIFFEADGDGDLDLYVVSGSVEYPLGSLAFLDRLYLNDGTGLFEEAPLGAIPNIPESGSCIAAADFDQDGDLDLFVGARVTPSRYPFASANHLLVNDGKGNFTDAISKIAPGLERSGMVTSAIWSDATGDGVVDLVVAHDWGNVAVFKNANGRSLDPLTPPPHAIGFWNSLAATDVDHDGDTDYIAGNLGLNSPYHATPDAPAVLFAGDLTGTRTFDLLEALSSPDASVTPIRSADAIAAALPSTMETTSPERLANASRFEANNLASGVFINDGDGGLTFSPLPFVAQLAPVHGIITTELNGDAHPDLVLAQNALNTHPETGPLDSALSVVLYGAGDGTFTAASPRESGIVITGDARALALIDANGDSQPDLLFSTNTGPTHLYLNTTPANSTKTVRILLKGNAGNPTAIGAKVSLRLSDGAPQSYEITAGSSYLSQSSTLLHFGIPQSSEASASYVVLWPDGATTSDPDAQGTGGTTIAISQP